MRPRLKAILLTGLVLLACLLGGCASEKTAEEEFAYDGAEEMGEESKEKDKQ